ncbi:MAG TPA: fructose PTS transporter subunit IIB [Verrucomicrobiae bacterium]|nr:fructose PTS transporter subunit IIB [Verrucomicrobiae bacterium]
MRIIAVTACKSGIAHAFMAAENLEKAAKRLGHAIKVETQGAIGIENELTTADVDAADGLIIASDVGIARDHRFAGMRKKVQSSALAALKNPEALFAQF